MNTIKMLQFVVLVFGIKELSSTVNLYTLIVAALYLAENVVLVSYSPNNESGSDT